MTQPAPLPVIYRNLGDLWTFQFQYLQEDGVTPVATTGLQFALELRPPGANVTVSPLATLQPASASDPTTATFVFQFDSRTLYESGVPAWLSMDRPGQQCLRARFVLLGVNDAAPITLSTLLVAAVLQ